ncbi:MAG: manganese efflux pump [Dehalococcoidales bacterium]|nr:MAG: manganese efflux pump [Dehalococcoidales bacterium]
MKSFTSFQVFRTALTFGFFQALMPVLGWLLGQTVVDFIADFDHWIAFVLLGFIGGKMIRESFQKKEEKQSLDITRGFLLITLAVATSIDALAVGLTFAFIEVNVALAVLIIGITAFLSTVVSFLIGKKIGKLAGSWAELIGGLILLAIGIRIVVTHLIG